MATKKPVKGAKAPPKKNPPVKSAKVGQSAKSGNKKKVRTFSKSKKKTKVKKKAGKKDKFYKLEELERELSITEKYFCQRLIYRMGNVTQAYKDTFPAAGMKTCETKGTQWLRIGRVEAYFNLLNQKTSAKNKVDIDYLLQKHKQISEFNILDLYNKKKYWTLKEVKNIPHEYGTLIQEINPTEAGIKIKMMDRQKALEALGHIAQIHEEKGEKEHTHIHLSFDKITKDL